jgi:formate dehydrogenase iron-sulfur subunit
MLELAKGRVLQLQKNGFAQASVYDPKGVNGTSVITVLAHGDHLDWYDLPANPHVPWGVKLWKKVVRPLGALAIFGAVIGAFGHYMNHGRKGVRGADTHDANLPDA